jgi:hypothetical protein
MIDRQKCVCIHMCACVCLCAYEKVSVRPLRGPGSCNTPTAMYTLGIQIWLLNNIFTKKRTRASQENGWFGDWVRDSAR